MVVPSRFTNPSPPSHDYVYIAGSLRNHLLARLITAKATGADLEVVIVRNACTLASLRAL